MRPNIVIDDSQTDADYQWLSCDLHIGVDAVR